MNGYRYTGSGERFRGVPARDITQEEFDRLGPLEQRRVTESGLYKPVKADRPASGKADEGKEAN